MKSQSQKKGKKIITQRKKFWILLDLIVGGWITLIELYVWLNKYQIILGWIHKDLLPHIPMAILAVFGSILIAKHLHLVRKRLPSVGFILKRLPAVIFSVFRFLELFLTILNLDEFLSWWPNGALCYLSIGWFAASGFMLVACRSLPSILSKIKTMHDQNIFTHSQRKKAK